MENERMTLRPLEVPANCICGGCAWWPKCEGCGFDRMEYERRI